MKLPSTLQENKWMPWAIAAVACAVLIWYIFAGRAKDPDHDALQNEITRVRDSLQIFKAERKLEIDQSKKREDSIKVQITLKEISLQNAIIEKNRAVQYYRDALHSGDVKTLQRYFSEYFRDTGQ